MSNANMATAGRPALTQSGSPGFEPAPAYQYLVGGVQRVSALHRVPEVITISAASGST